MAEACECGNEPSGNFLTSCKPVSFSRRTLHHGVSKYLFSSYVCMAWTETNLLLPLPLPNTTFVGLENGVVGKLVMRPARNYFFFLQVSFLCALHIASSLWSRAVFRVPAPTSCTLHFTSLHSQIYGATSTFVCSPLCCNDPQKMTGYCSNTSLSSVPQVQQVPTQ